MIDRILPLLRDLIQRDVGQRGLATDPEHNLINAFPDDFQAACHSLAEHLCPGLAIVTGFFIPTATPAAGETDGPLGALFLARALAPLGIPVAIATDDFCIPAMKAGLAACNLGEAVPLVELPARGISMTPSEYWHHFASRLGSFPLSHLLAIERVGPNHSFDVIPKEHRDHCHTMRGRDIHDLMSPAHLLFDEENRKENITTIGIGDGGNEIGMGKIPWNVIERNIPRGGLIACRVPTRHLIVCGVSNWGAYALAAGISAVCGRKLDASLFDSEVEQQILQVMVDEGPLVDGPLGTPTATVDGLSWESYAEVLVKIGEAMQKNSREGQTDVSSSRQ